MRRIISLFIGVIILILVVSTQIQSFDQLFNTQKNAHWGNAFISFLFFFSHGLIIYLAWATSLNYYDINISKKESAVIHFISLLSRYLPGGVWHIAGRFLAVVKKGGDAKRVLSTLYLEQSIAILSCLLIIVIVFWYRPSTFTDVTNFSLENWASVLTLILVISLAFPRILIQLINFFFSLFNKHKIQYLSKLQHYNIFALHLISMLLYAVGYYYSAYVYTSNPDLINLIGIVMLATFLGFIAIFVPSGLGIREGAIIAYLNTQGVDGEVAVSIVLLPRLLILLAEILSILLSLTLMKVWGGNA